METKEKVNIPYFLTREYAIKQKKIEKVVGGVVGFAVAFGLGVLVSKALSLHK